MQIWVRNISGGQANVYSTSPEYSVACKFNPGVRPPNTTFLRNRSRCTRNGSHCASMNTGTVGPMSSFIPERGTAPCPDLCIGWDHILDGSFLWLFHWNTYDRAFWGYDPRRFPGLESHEGDSDADDRRAVTPAVRRAREGGSHQDTVEKGTTQTFGAPYPDDGDFNWPAPVQFAAGSATIDVTSIVQAWASGKMPNQGFVLRGKLEDNGSDGNDSCSLVFGRDVVLTIEQ